MSTVLAIDPSIRSCGWAYFVKRKLEGSGTLTSKAPFPHAADQIVDLLEILRLKSVYTLVIEYPTYEQSLRGKVSMLQGHTLNLAYLCGLIVGRIAYVNLLLPTPIKWKGNLPKRITQQRLEAKGYSFDTSDEADAIALGLWALSRS